MWSDYILKSQNSIECSLNVNIQKIESKGWKDIPCQVWWCIPVRSALGRLRQEDHKFKASVRYTARQKQKRKKRKKVYL
jgi:hypothetical protein